MALIPTASDLALSTEDPQQVLHEVQAIFQHATVGIVLTRARLVVRCNKAFADMFGYTIASLMGQPGRIIYPSDEAYAEMGQQVGPVLAKGQPYRTERYFVRSDGSAVLCAVSATAVEPLHPEWGTTWIFDDVTRERQQQADLKAALLENQAILDSAALGIALLKDRHVQRCNPQLEAMFGYPSGSMKDFPVRNWYPTQEAFDWVGNHLYPQMAAGGTVTHEQRLMRGDGSLFWVRMSGRHLRSGSPMLEATLWLLDDITQKRETEEALMAATALNQVVFESAGAAIIATDTQGVIQLFNAAAERMLGYQAAEVVYLQTPAVLHDPTEVVDYARVLSAEFGEEVTPGFDVFCVKARRDGKDEREWTYICKNGQRITVTLCVTALKDSSARITGYLGIATDISERRRAQRLIEQSQIELEVQVVQRTAELAQTNARLQTEVAERVEIERQMREMAHFDGVTGLPNRNLLHDRMAHALMQGHRDGCLVAVMFLDLDRFKNINDTLGHSVGDALLRKVADRLSMALRATDTLARIGGDEFVVVLPGLADVHAAQQVVTKLLSALQAPMEVMEHALHITTSIGICVYPQDGGDTDVLLRNADTAMYQAKAAGRNTARFFTESMNLAADQVYRIESALRVGVRDNELRLLFQPLVDIAENRIFGVEALVRWQSGTLGLVPPGQFISIAEETDLICEIDSWVMRQALTQAALWRKQGCPDLILAVNLSARQFRRKDLLAFVADTLAQTAYPAHLLELEITESSLMHNVSEVIQTLDQLVALGVRLAIDDFGTGYSSLAYLKRFPVHKLKVDQSFVRDIGQANSDLAIVKTVIALAQTLKLDLLAEGVETSAHLMTLRALGCERFQGYLFSRPIPAEQLEPLLGCSATELIALNLT
jgi:diguanylate cyclase (GGDEF)-like protein/PAS domain S-box-containing protein